MHANSSAVNSDQIDIHQQLSILVAKHARSVFQKPISLYNQSAFDNAITAWQTDGSKPLILDAGCGVGLSTLHLASSLPDHFVIGIDQSADRSARKPKWQMPIPDNFVRVRANMVDFWRLLLQHNLHPAKQYLLYPNPWPKSTHLARRWHGHAVFPTIVALGGQIECRSNWRIYIDEFAAALTQITEQAVMVEHFIPTQTITPFEQKYLASGHVLWRCTTQIKPVNLASDQSFFTLDTAIQNII